MSAYVATITIEAPSMAAAMQEIHKALYVADVEASSVEVEEIVRFTELDTETYDQSLTSVRLFEGDVDPG